MNNITVMLNGRIVTQGQYELFQRDLRLFCSTMGARLAFINYRHDEVVYKFEKISAYPRPTLQNPTDI